MKIQRLAVENFGPFCGKHEIDLDVSPTAPVVVINGENMRGKTTLQNAIRWCLYGQAFGRKGVPKPSHRLLSYDAIDSGQYFMSATLEFSHEDHDFELNRHVESDEVPQSDCSLSFTTSLRKDGHFVPQRQITPEIEGVLHHDIARFFLFDGEMLSQYEELLDVPAHHTEMIKQSIEKILGLPALQQAQADLRMLHMEAGQQQAGVVRRQKEAARLAASESQLSNAVQALGDDLVRLQEIEGQLAESRDGLLAQRDRLVGIEADLQLEEQIEERQKSAQADIQSQRERIKTLVQEAWWLPAAGIARRISGELAAAAEEQRHISTEITIARQSIAQLESLTDQAVCPVCDQRIDEGRKDHHRNETEKLHDKVRLLEKAGSGTGDPTRIRLLRPFEDSQALATITEIEQSIRKAELQVRRDGLELRDVKERLWGNRPDTKEIQRQYDETVTQLDEVAKQIAYRAQLLDEKKSKLLAARRRLANSPGADPKIALRSNVLESLVDAFTHTIDSFRDEMTQIVEEAATDIFLKLTTEPEYKRLEINRHFGLDIIAGNDRVIRERSAGAEQIVAFALIGALNRSAVRKGPIVMDTPFGRLDRQHRGNVLSFIPTMSEQVILLVQSGEIDEDRDLGSLEKRISHHYKLIRDGAPTRSRIDLM